MATTITVQPRAKARGRVKAKEMAGLLQVGLRISRRYRHLRRPVSTAVVMAARSRQRRLCLINRLLHLPRVTRRVGPPQEVLRTSQWHRGILLVTSQWHRRSILLVISQWHRRRRHNILLVTSHRHRHSTQPVFMAAAMALSRSLRWPLCGSQLLSGWILPCPGYLPRLRMPPRPLRLTLLSVGLLVSKCLPWASALPSPHRLRSLLQLIMWVSAR